MAQEEKQQIKGIVRIAASDVPGVLPAVRALRRIKGISHPLAHYICIETKTDPSKKVGLMSEDEIKILENFVKDPKLPSHLLNRQKDMDTGKDTHLIGTNLDFRKREDIHFMRKIRCYKGIRHELGQPVRGQRTRSSFRTQKTVGVVKKKQQPTKAASK
ncbi:MAG: 30S ribosomal protein S13 [Candidatus Aenigmarchaeota archaeon]|nr:30S ribosomal protein S13 [Candidatus Aenigmarchaeota archaeon]